MKTLTKILICFTILLSNLSGQSLVNGDLEGVITGYSSLPSSWSAINYTDINCQADPGGTSPDLINTTQPGNTVNGIIGTPFSGNTFVGGSYGGTPTGTFFHEGIQQNVSGFTIGEIYVVRFHQAVIKTQYSSDTSGTWMIILDNTIIGVPAFTVSHEPYNSISTNWEMRTVFFTASQNSHDFKFLPYDDDSNQVSTIGDQSGGLYMGIDSISIQQATGVGIIENNFENSLLLYPNPTNGNFLIDLGTMYKSVKIKLTDAGGKEVQSGSYNESQLLNFKIKEAAGIYYLVVEDEKKRAVIKLIIE